MVEAVLIEDDEGTIHVMKGHSYGKIFKEYIKYDSSYKENEDEKI